jgi:hypothetical protein
VDQTNQKPTDGTLTPLGLVLTLVRENGLIVISLLILVWCIYFLGNVNREQRAACQASITDFRAELAKLHEARTRGAEEISAQLASLNNTDRIVLNIMSDVEEECLLRKATKVDNHPIGQP